MSEVEDLVGRLPWLRELRRALARDIVEELRHGEWIDQTVSVLGRNRHVRLAKRLIREASIDALYSEDGKWMVRREAVDREIHRLNSEEPPASCAHGAINRMRESDKLATPPPLRPCALAKASIEPEDEAGIYERSLLERVRGH